MSVDKFHNLIAGDYLWFSRLDKFSDQHEGRAALRSIDDKWWKEWVFASCWNMDKNENFALWNIYLGKNSFGLAIESTIEELLGSIDNNADVGYASIDYLPFGTELKFTNPILAATKKYDFYEYENEVRFFQYFGGRVDASGFEVKVNTKKLIKKIILSPMMSPDQEGIVKALLDKYGFDVSVVEYSVIKDKI